MMKIPNHQCAQAERGAVVLAAAILVPLLFLLLIIAVELATFFRVRESLRSYLDNAARSALRYDRSMAEAVRDIEAGLAGFSATISEPQVAAVIANGLLTVSVTGDYKGIASGVLWGFIEGSEPRVTMSAAAQVRAIRAADLILFDRTIPTDRDTCLDADFNRVKQFVSEMAAELSSRSGIYVGVATLPAGGDGAVLLSASEYQPGIDECNLTSDPLVGSVSASHASPPGLVDYSAALETLVDEFFATAGSPEIVSVHIATRDEATSLALLEPAIVSMDRVLRLMGFYPRFGHVAFGATAQPTKWFGVNTPVYTRVVLNTPSNLRSEHMAAFVMPSFSSVISR